MNRWRKTIVLKDLLGPDGSDDATRTAAAELARRLKRLPEYDDFELESIVSEFEGIADPNNDPVTLPTGTLCGYFNEVLSSLYDWADAERIWIGGEWGRSFDDVRKVVG